MHQRTLSRLLMPVIIILLSYPMSVYAAEIASHAGFDLSTWGMWALFAAANAGGVLNARNCRYTGDSAKMKSGNVVVTNDGALT